MWVFRAVLLVILFAVLVGFSVYNAGERVSVTLPLFQVKYIDFPLIYVAYWAFIFGLVVSSLLFVTVCIKQAAELRKHKRSLSALNNEVSALRNRTISEAEGNFLIPKEDNK